MTRSHQEGPSSVPRGESPTFRSNGMGRGKASNYEIRRATPADFEAIERESLITTIRGATSDTWKYLPLEKLRQAAALADEASKLRRDGET
jgi:hypothetical protein